MPIHLNDLDVSKRAAGLQSALIIPCYICPAVSVAVREEKPFIQFPRHLLKSPPFAKYIKDLQARLSAQGIVTQVFASRLIHQWFLCLWPAGRRRKLLRQLNQYVAAIVLGCDSATETVRELVAENGCEVIQGMQVAGFMNAKIRFSLPGNIAFAGCRVVPLPGQSRAN